MAKTQGWPLYVFSLQLHSQPPPIFAVSRFLFIRSQFAFYPWDLQRGDRHVVEFAQLQFHLWFCHSPWHDLNWAILLIYHHDYHILLPSYIVCLVIQNFPKANCSCIKTIRNFHPDLDWSCLYCTDNFWMPQLGISSFILSLHGWSEMRIRKVTGNHNKTIHLIFAELRHFRAITSLYLLLKTCRNNKWAFTNHFFNTQIVPQGCDKHKR